MSDFLYHHGVKGMKWGVRRDKSSFDTRFRPTSLSKPGVGSLSGPKLLTVNGINVDYKNKNHRKAAKAAMKEGYQYDSTFKSKGNNRDRLSAIGNKFVKSLKDQKVNTKEFDKNIDDIRASQKLYNFNKKNKTNLDLIKTGFGYVYQNPDPKKRKLNISGEKVRDYSKDYKF